MRAPATALFAALCFALADRPAPAAAQEKPAAAKWEYGELTYRVTRSANEGGVSRATVIKWTTGAGELSVNAWAELAERLKAEAKKDEPASLQRVRALNALGAAGWELVSQERSPASGDSVNWLFKRRVP